MELKHYKVFVFCLLICCQPKNNIKNDIKTLDEVFNQKAFDFEIKHFSCFGGLPTDTLEISKEGEYYYLNSKRTQRSHQIKIDQIDSLKKYLSTRIGKSVYEGNCASSSYYNMRFGTNDSSVDFELNACGPNPVNNLLNYRDLLDEEK